MNAIDAHKGELERLLTNLCRDTAVSGTAFLALLDAYVIRLDNDCSDSVHALIQRRCRSTGNQHGTDSHSELRPVLRATYNSKTACSIVPKFWRRSSATRVIHSAADQAPRIRFRGGR